MALMPHQPNDLMIRKLDSIFPLSDEERGALQQLPILLKGLKADQEIVGIGERPAQSCLILEGFTCAYKLSHLGKRQIMALHVPGDMPDLQSLHLAVMDMSIASISSCTVGFIQHEDLRRLCEQHPRLTAAFWRETLVDASIYREWLLNVGQRSAYTRMAHLVCEILIRLKAVGLVEKWSFQWPITQEKLADALGITAVHVSRTLQALRADGLIRIEKTQVSVPDWERLKEAGEFDPLYLHLQVRKGA
ncbi:Crp/Fnr family transcriptional regulator [Halomonas desiderata]|uniref:Crp/Fnr family transcriptional regulator n=1 Tax=Billgrantia desiderata TaxID=52021 RepID=UPI001748F517|nr:Crp/Fnr family transcriptional regulator [Halomonas desiderata]MCE8010542.1 Crp/Fnr family transcriptional regulator [Halomonas desiderata]NIC35157.1 Crp/Fnr family transcriptional regulator [Halomonas desiderata]